MKQLFILGLVVSGLMAAGQGYNQPSFSFFDTNGDGKITKSEFDDGRAKRMEENKKSGKRMRNAENAPSFSDIDKNGDGIISKKEFTKHQEAMRSV